MAEPLTTPALKGLDFAEAKLQSSGLTIQDALALGMSCAVASSFAPLFHPIRALRMPYLDIDGSDSGFYRIRYIEQLPGFAGQVAKPRRYMQEPSTLNWVYLPHLPTLNWAGIAADATIPLIITEGELKAACACARGFITVGLGGVSTYKSTKNGLALLPPLDKFNWKGRQVTIIFDSDAATNPNVAYACKMLTQELLKRGTLPRVASLPTALNGDKQGLDDFLVADCDLNAVLSSTRSWEIGDALLEFNKHYALVRQRETIIDLKTTREIDPNKFVNVLHANVRKYDQVIRPNGQPKLEEYLIPREWLNWPSRNEVNDIVYEPGNDKITEENNFNMWPGWGVEPEPGDIAPWSKLLDFLFHNAPDARRWFEQWCAYPIQHPGAKLYTAVLIWGPEQGTGKTLVGKTLSYVYGKNAITINSDQLHSQFTGWMRGRQFILGEEVAGSDKRGEADKIKTMITQEYANVNEKFEKHLVLRDTLNYYLTSNRSDALYLDDQDRRIFVWRTPLEPLPEAWYRDVYDPWLKSSGPSHLMRHLQTLSLEGFNPAGKAPRTSSKEEMIRHGKSDLGDFVDDFLANLDSELAELARQLSLPESPDIILNKHLQRLYDPDKRTRVTPNGIGRALAAAGVKSLYVNRTVCGSKTFYILRNAQHWLHCPGAEIKAYIDKIYRLTVAPKKEKF